MKENRIYLSHIYEQTGIILMVSSRVSRDDFLKDQIYQNAVIRSLEVIGEATKKISPEFRKKYPHIPWRLMAGTRDRLIHGYFSVDLDEVWKTVTENIPLLHIEIAKLLE